MFPATFADTAVEEYTQPGEVVLDPFSGRGTSLYSAATRGRIGWGVEINPVGWLYTRAKLNPAPKRAVIARLEEIAAAAKNFRTTADELPEFYQRAYCLQVRRFLLAARKRLDWRKRATDQTLAALLMVDLHGKLGYSLSNQMRQTKGFSPNYAVSWWAEKGLEPPEVEPVEFMTRKLRWRYARGRPETTKGRLFRGDSLQKLRDFRSIIDREERRAKLVLTSPPYFRSTNYHYDQWLRLWLLGGSALPVRNTAPWSNRFENRVLYKKLLSSVFRKVAELTDPSATVLVRAGRDAVTFSAVRDALSAAFPEWRLATTDRPIEKCQTTLFNKDAGPRKGEVDFLLQP